MAFIEVEIQETRDRGTFLALKTQAGHAHPALRDYTDKYGVGFSAEQQNKAFTNFVGKKALHADQVKIFKALGDSLIRGETLLCEITDIPADKRKEVAEKLVKHLQREGHSVSQSIGRKSQPIARLRSDENGNWKLDVHPLDASMATMRLASVGIQGEIEAVDGRVQLGFSAPQGKVASLADPFDKRLRLVCMPGTGIDLKQPDVVRVSFPVMSDGKNSVWLHLEEGSWDRVARDFDIPLDGGDSVKMSGESKEIARKLRNLIKLNKIRSEIKVPTEFSPIVNREPVKYCLKQAILKDKRMRAKIPAQEQAPVEYALEGAEFSEKQKEGVAFMVSRPSALIADEPGSGKTLMLAAAANIKAEPGKKILVVCPTDLLEQWVNEVHSRIPIPGKGEQPPMADEELPDWVDPKSDTRKKYEQIRHRFEFLRMSALENNLTVRRNDLREPVDATDARAANARRHILSVANDEYDVMVVDEAHELRAVDTSKKFDIVDAIRRGKLGSGKPIEKVLLGTATPTYRAGTDLYAPLRLLGVRKFQRMNPLRFCQEYLMPKVQERDGRLVRAPESHFYSYEGVRDERVGELQSILSDLVIHRTKKDLAPGKFRPVRITSALPLDNTASNGERLKDIRVDTSKLFQLPDDLSASIDQAEHEGRRKKRLALAKVPETVRRVTGFLSEPEHEREKAVVFTTSLDAADALYGMLHKNGTPAYMLTGSQRIGPSGENFRSKRDLIANFNDRDARVLVATLDASSQGLDGLHKTCTRAFINDLSQLPGVMEQAPGRISRIFNSADPFPDVPFSEVELVQADHPTEKRLWSTLVKRWDHFRLMQECGSLVEIDSTSKRAIHKLQEQYLYEKIRNRGIPVEQVEGIDEVKRELEIDNLEEAEFQQEKSAEQLLNSINETYDTYLQSKKAPQTPSCAPAM